MGSDRNTGSLAGPTKWICIQWVFAAMTVCHGSTVALDSEALAYFGPDGAHWRVPVEAVQVIGEFKTTAEDEGHFLAVIIDDSGAWFRAPCCAAGFDQVIEQLGRNLKCDLHLRLGTAVPPHSQVLWPPRLAGQSLFATYRTENDKGSTALGEHSSGWSLHPNVVAFLRQGGDVS